MKKSVVLNFGFFVCALQGQNPVVIRDPNLLADERIWSLLVGERVGFCVGDSVYREKLKEVRDGVIYFQAMPFSYMPKVSLPLSKTDSVLVWLPLHEEERVYWFLSRALVVEWPALFQYQLSYGNT
ncbi:MAG: hypothetical protein ABIM46_01720 [candidate division WOR-3 bacterium]